MRPTGEPRMDAPTSAQERVLLFGAGTMGRTHAAAWQRLGCQIACVIDPHREAGKTLALEVGAHHCATPEAAIDRHPLFDVADIAVPTFAHGEVLASLPKRRRLVVLEKPAERDPDRVRHLLAAARDRDLSLFVAQVVRFFPGYRALHDIIQSRGVDAVHHMRLRRIGPTPHGRDDWFLNESQSGGLFLDLLIHDLDFCLWTFGAPDRVIARTSRPPETGGGGHPAPLHATAVLAYEGRRVVHLEGSWMFPGPFSTRVEANADWGTLVLDSEQERSLQIFSPASQSQAWTAQGRAAPSPVRAPYGTDLEDPYTLELQAALSAYRTGEDPLPVTPDDALRAVVLADLCRRAAESGGSLPWPGNRSLMQEGSA